MKSRTSELFPETKQPRPPRRQFMHYIDVGHHSAAFQCGKCGHKSEWIHGLSISEIKRGFPCPMCSPVIKKTLHLHVTFEYFDAIKNKIKPDEFRDPDKWKHKLDNDGYTAIRIHRAYQKVSPDTEIDLPYKGYQLVTIAHPHFGNEPKELCAIDVRH